MSQQWQERANAVNVLTVHVETLSTLLLTITAIDGNQEKITAEALLSKP